MAESVRQLRGNDLFSRSVFTKVLLIPHLWGLNLNPSSSLQRHSCPNLSGAPAGVYGIIEFGGTCRLKRELKR